LVAIKFQLIDLIKIFIKIFSQNIMNLAAGTLLQQGKYTIEAVLAEGYLHTTYRAFDSTSGQIVVLKTLSDRLMAKVPKAKWSLFSQEFKNKAKKLFDCRHQHLVKVLEYFTENSAGNSQDFLVMEYIAGPNLGELLKYGHSLTPSQAIHYISQAAIALAALHNKGLLHDQVCPQNMIRQAGTNQIMLTDVNLIDHLFLSAHQISIKHKLTGYSAPELFPELSSELSSENLTITKATDIYSLSASLYSLLSSEIPITAPLRAKKSLTDLHLFHPHLPEAIASTILRGMALQPTERPQTVTLWLKQLTVPKSLHSQTASEQSHLRSYSMSISSVSDLPKVETTLTKQSENLPVTTMPARLLDTNLEPIKQSAIAVINPPAIEKTQSINPGEKTAEQENSVNNFTQNLYKKPIWQPLHLPYYAIQILTFLLFLGTSVFSTWLGFTITLHLQGDRHLKSRNNSSPINSILRPQDQSTPIFDSLSKEENDQPAFPVRVKTPVVRATPDESLEVLPEEGIAEEEPAVNEILPTVDVETAPETVLDDQIPAISTTVEPSELPSTENYTDETINNDPSVPLESPLPTESTLENIPSDQVDNQVNPTPLETTINPIESDDSNTSVTEQLENSPVAIPTTDPSGVVNPDNTTPNNYDNSDLNNLPANDILPTEEQTQLLDKS
jgi:serine/threonine-protein kinase